MNIWFFMVNCQLVIYDNYVPYIYSGKFSKEVETFCNKIFSIYRITNVKTTKFVILKISAIYVRGMYMLCPCLVISIVMWLYVCMFRK